MPEPLDRLERLVGAAGLERLGHSHVMVVGVGGVGSFAAEALVRSGVGSLTLVDDHVVSSTNINRQVQALPETVGQLKVSALARRLLDIRPDLRLLERPIRYDASTTDTLLATGALGHIDYVVDAIDSVDAKCHLLVTCTRRGLPVVCSTGAAGRLDPTRVAVADLGRTRIDKLAATIRRVLRHEHGFPHHADFGIPAVYSTEPPLTGRGPLGSAVFVTGVFGMAAASVVVRGLVG